jgi:internalin A
MRLTKYIIAIILVSILVLAACNPGSDEPKKENNIIGASKRSVTEYILGLEIPVSEAGLRELQLSIESILSPIPLPASLPGNYQIQRVIPRESGIIAKGMKVPEINIVLSDKDIPGQLDPNDFHRVIAGSADLWPEIFDSIGHQSIVLTLYYWRGYPVPSSYYYETFMPSPEANYLPEYLGLETGGTEKIGNADVFLMTYGDTTWAEWRMSDWEAPQFIIRAMPGKEVTYENFKEVIASIELPGEELLLPYAAETYSSDRLFPDPNLEAYFLDNFPNLTAPVTAEDVKGVDAISAPGRNIISLTGLEHCPDLKYLNLENNHIMDLSPLIHLDNLIEVNLTGNRITDVSPLAKHKDLKKLELGYNDISDAAPLASLVSLEHLDLGWNQIGASLVGSLSQLSRLTHLDLGVNDITNITTLSDLKNLAYLYLNHNRLNDILPLSKLTGVQELYLGDNRISDISPLSGLTQLRSLGLYHNQITNIASLVNLKQIEYLDLRVNEISDLTSFAGVTFPELKRIDFRYNYISDGSPLIQASMPKIQIITLEGNKLTEKEISEIIYDLIPAH